MFSQHMKGFSQGTPASSHCSESTIQYLQYLVFVRKQEANLALKGVGGSYVNYVVSVCMCLPRFSSVYILLGI